MCSVYCRIYKYASNREKHVILANTSYSVTKVIKDSFTPLQHTQNLVHVNMALQSGYALCICLASIM